MSDPVGDWSALRPADEEIEEICNKVKPELERKSKRKFTEFFVYAYKVQLLIGGSNYIVKVYIEQGECIFLTIYDMFMHGVNTRTLVKFEEGKKPYDIIDV